MGHGTSSANGALDTTPGERNGQGRRSAAPDRLPASRERKDRLPASGLGGVACRGPVEWQAVKRRLFIILSAPSLLLFVAMGSSGCSRLVDGLQSGGEIGNVKGTWRGTLTAVTLYDHAGTAYEGVALKTDAGPSLPTPVPASRGGGSLPILVTNTLPCRILDPASLPMGKPVRVTGIMCMNHACVREEQEVSGPHSLLRTNDATPHMRWEHVIMVTRAPTLVNE